MSNETTDRFKGDGSGEPSTRDLVLQLRDLVLQGLDRTARLETAMGIGEADTQPLSGRVNRLVAELAEVKSDLAEVKSDLAEVKIKVSYLESEVKSIRRFAFDAVGQMGRMHNDLDDRLTEVEQHTDRS